MEANKTIKQNNDEDENVYNTSHAQVEEVLRSQQHLYANDGGDETVYNTSQAQIEAVLSSQQHLEATINGNDQRLENLVSSKIKENVNSCYEEVMPDLPTYSPTDIGGSKDILTTPFKRPSRNLLLAALILIIFATGITISVVVLIMKWPSNDIAGRVTYIFFQFGTNRKLIRFYII